MKSMKLYFSESFYNWTTTTVLDVIISGTRIGGA